MRLEELLKKEGLSSSEISELLYRINTEKQDDEKKIDISQKQAKRIYYRFKRDITPYISHCLI